MAQTMKDVKAISIPVNGTAKAVKKIEDANGNIIWGSYDAFPYRRLEYLNMLGYWINTNRKPAVGYYYMDCKLPATFTGPLGSWGMLFGAEGYTTASERWWFAMKNNNSGTLFQRIKNQPDTDVSLLSDLNADHKYQAKMRTYFTNNTIGRWWIALQDLNTDTQVYGQYYNNSSLAMDLDNFNTVGINIAKRKNSGGEYDSQKGYADFKLFRYFIKADNDESALIYDMYPCQRKSDGVCGIYDVVNSVFYPCEGSDPTSIGGTVVDEYWDLTTPS